MRFALRILSAEYYDGLDYVVDKAPKALHRCCSESVRDLRALRIAESVSLFGNFLVVEYSSPDYVVLVEAVVLVYLRLASVCLSMPRLISS